MKTSKYTDKKIRIKISNFNGFSPNFANITEGSEHDVIEPPKEYARTYPNGEKGYWIMGVSEPARVLSGEYKIIIV